MIFSLGLGDRVVAVSRYTAYPPEAKELPQIADLFTIDREAALRLEPTHAVGTYSQKDILDFFDKHTEARTLEIGKVETFAEIKSAMEKIAKEFGISSRLDRYTFAPELPEDIAPPEEKKRVLWVIGYGPELTQVYAAGHGTYLNELIDAAGGENIVPEDLGAYPVLSKELIIELNPEVLIQATDEEKLEKKKVRTRSDWAALSVIDAVKNESYGFITEEGILVPGPRAETYVDEVYRAIHR